MYKFFGSNTIEYTELSDKWLDYKPDLSHANPLLNKMIKELTDIEKIYLSPAQTPYELNEKLRISIIINYLKTYKDLLND